MRELQLTDEACLDLADLHAWIRVDDPRRAGTFLAELLGVCELLAEQPGIGRRREDLGPGVQVHVHQQRLIVYRSDATRVLVLRVLHGARSLTDQLDAGDDE